VFDALNEIWGKEPTTNPPIIIESDGGILEQARASTDSPRTPSPMPSSDGMDGDTDSSSFTTGKKVKQRKNNTTANKVLEVLSDHLAFKGQEIEEKKKEREDRKKEREERRAAQVKLDEAIIKAQESSAKIMDSVTTFMKRMMNGRSG
jgi:hypothetical protein